MARVFAVDCLDAVPNRFDLTLLAARRAREVHNGAPSAIPANGHSAPVLALKEIAAGAICPRDIENRLIESLRRVRPADDDDRPEFERIDEGAMLAALNTLGEESVRHE
ncbi:DNA-directed RNA polymerase subunit omega [Hyphococcus sp.]|uniref:DNA-directed RNA polymerase subunit omega n=1 Tax=Hyphococcus sp. TaxID=2038636 RepID=UPI003D0BA3D8